MKTVPARLRLIDFSNETVEPARWSSTEPEPEVNETQMNLVEFQPDTEPLITQQELDEAVAQARTEMEAGCSDRVQQIQDDCEKELQAERARAVDQYADTLFAKVSEEFDGMSRNLANRLVEKCAPVLGGLAQDQALAELVGIVTAIARANCRLEVCGPAELLAALRGRIDALALEVDWKEAPGTDISIRLGDTIVETQLSDWFSALAETNDGR